MAKFNTGDFVFYTDSKGATIAGKITEFNTSFINRRAKLQTEGGTGQPFKYVWVLVRNLCKQTQENNSN